ncbi:hypothetical protein PV703_08555 [Streptomyces sp. ME01-24h]|nr:hypothetical protein [Streptomyces sp. ME01-24h]
MDLDEAPPSPCDRGALDSAVFVHPTMQRLQEVLQVYGPVIKELIHEQFGDCTMNAVDPWTSGASPIRQATGRVVALEGTFLPYEWSGRSSQDGPAPPSGARTGYPPPG